MTNNYYQFVSTKNNSKSAFIIEKKQNQPHVNYEIEKTNLGLIYYENWLNDLNNQYRCHCLKSNQFLFCMQK